MNTKVMKKTALASALSAVLLGLTACSNSTAPEATASVAFSANFPDTKEAQAAVIDNDAVEIVVKLYHIRTLIANAQAYFNENDMGYYSSYLEQTLAELDKYESLDTVTATEATYFANISTNAINALKSALASNGSSLDEIMPNRVLRTLQPDSSTANIEGLTLGAYFIATHQKDAEETIISSQKLFAVLGEGANDVASNMITGTWTLVDAQGNPSPYQFGLLSSTDASVAYDWLPMVDGTQSIMEAFSFDAETGTSNVSSAVQLNKIHYLSSLANPVPRDSSGYPLYEAYNFLYNISDSTTGFSQNVAEFGDDYDEGQAAYGESIETETHSYYINTSMNGKFNQAYDFRLEGDKNIANPHFFNMEFYIESYEYETETSTEMEAGAFVISNYFLGSQNTNDGDVYQYSSSYTDANGDTQNIVIVNAYNWQESYEVASDQQDPLQIAPASLSNGNTVSGTLIEYIDHPREWNYQNGESVNPITDDTALRQYLPDPTEVGMAMAMAALNPSAEAAAAHPLGSNCSDLEFTYIDQNATYALIDGEWVAGTVNYSYDIDEETDSTTGETTYTVNGNDLNGDGTIDFFETGVVYNYTYGEVYNDETGEYETTETSQDLDGDGTAEQYEAIIGFEYQDNNSITACTFPIRLTGTTLEVPRTDFYDDSDQQAAVD